jgi:hypothetical protein
MRLADRRSCQRGLWVLGAVAVASARLAAAHVLGCGSDRRPPCKERSGGDLCGSGEDICSIPGRFSPPRRSTWPAAATVEAPTGFQASPATPVLE